MKKYLSILMSVLLLLGLFASCSGNSAEVTHDTSASEVKESSADLSNNEKQIAELPEDVKVKFTMENGGEFTIELYPEYAPQTCINFINLVDQGYYDGLEFHRVIDDFMAQGGDGADVPSIYGEFSTNGFTQNTLSHQRGVVSMARIGGMNDSASSQFFICYDDCSFLDGQYAAFGKVIEGMDVVDGFLKIKREGPEGGTPTEPIVIKSAEVIA